MQHYVVYYRVSTAHQGASGLGLSAQQSAVEQFLSSNKAQEVPPSFTEIESGKHDNRPQLRRAVNRAKETGATLLIAKLDRLSRNVAFIFTLKEELHRAGVDFVALDLPEANTLTLGIMASMAQHEREIISQRTKAGLQAAKARGQKLGTPGNLTEAGRTLAHATIRLNAQEDKATRHAYHFMRPLREGGMSYDQIAELLNAEGYASRYGKPFHKAQVRKIWLRFSAPDTLQK